MGDSHTFLLHRYTRNWISNIGLGYIILFYYVMLCYIIGYMLFWSMLISGTILLKNVLNVSASSSSSAIVVLFLFNVMHSLSKEKRDYSNQFSIISNYFSVKFPKWSHLTLRRIFMRCLCLLKKLFASFFLSHKYFVSKFWPFHNGFL